MLLYTNIYYAYMLYILIYIIHVCCRPHSFREEDLSFSHNKSMGANVPWGVANLDPRGRLAGFM